MSESSAPRWIDTVDGQALDAAIRARAEEAFGLLERLVAEPSVVGHEQGAEEVLALELGHRGFAIERFPIPADIGERPGAGVPLLAYDGRYDIVARRGPADAPRRLLLNGHIDVVPADEPDLWTTPPFRPTRHDGWLVGRGAGDMKCGFAMAALALDGLAATHPASLDWPISVVAAIEEECTGNGTLAAAAAGVLGDAVIVLEPTDLDLLLGGIGIAWFEVAVVGRAGHAEAAQASVNAFDLLAPVVDALRGLEAGLNATVDDPLLAGTAHPYNFNIGKVRSGDWGSSVPAKATMEVRIGYPRGWTHDRIEAVVRSTIAEATRDHAWLAGHPPVIRSSGFRADGYALPADDALAIAMSDAHLAAHGSRPVPVFMASTTDARHYVNRFDRPALCYGPRTRNMHGIDEAVDLESIVQGARTLARFIADWFRP